MDKRTIDIGVISDTHGLLRPEALTALQGSDFIIHAGDVGDPDILQHLQKIAPVTAVRGNVDVAPWSRRLPETAVFRQPGIAIYIIHDVQELEISPEREGYAAVICGHSHKPMNEMQNGVLFFNPGSAGPRRFNLPVSIGRLRIENEKLTGHIVQLDIAGG
jgi:uncharacterized protein